MNFPSGYRVIGVATLAAAIVVGTAAAWAGGGQGADPLRGKPLATGYALGTKTRDGLGKYYFGREIAHFMSHVGAPWLERPERDREERPGLVMKALNLQPGPVVADIGCVTGYFSWRFAEAVGPQGKVYGVEIQQEMLDMLAKAMAARGVTNVIGVVGTP